MAKLQETIREMSKKKLLNGDQKKVLFKLFSGKLEQTIEEKTSSYHDELNKYLASELDKIRKSGTILGKAIRDYEKAVETAERLKSVIKRHPDTDINYSDEVRIEADNHAGYKKLKDKQDNQKREMLTLKDKLLADIYGVPMTYDEMTGYLDKEIATIEGK